MGHKKAEEAVTSNLIFLKELEAYIFSEKDEGIQLSALRGRSEST